MARGNENIHLSVFAWLWGCRAGGASSHTRVAHANNRNQIQIMHCQLIYFFSPSERQCITNKSQTVLSLWRLGCSMYIPSHTRECGEASYHGYLIRSVCWFEQRPYAVKWKQKTKFSWAILLFLLQVLGHFTKAAQTRMSLVLKPQVNLPLFHMIKPDNCVLIANVVGEIQFLGPS